MQATDSTLVALAATQHQVFSRAQARAAGLTPSALSKRLRNEALVASGVAALHHRGVTLSYRGELMAGLLNLGEPAVVSGAAAAYLHGLDGFAPGALEFLVEHSHRRRQTVGTVHTMRRFEPLDRVCVDGLACASPTLTVTQLLAHAATDEQAADALDSACRMRLTAVPVVGRRLSNQEQRGRPGTGRFAGSSPKPWSTAGSSGASYGCCAAPGSPCRSPSDATYSMASAWCASISSSIMSRS